MKDELITRQAATTIPVMPKEHRHYQTNNLDDAYEQGWNDLQECIENLPPVHPEILASGEGELDVPDMNVGDMISRQAAIDALMVAINDVGILDGDDIRVVFDNLPPAQPTQEIIRCKDCRFWKKYKYFNGKPTYAPFCGFNSIFTDDNDFCSRAERRDEADDH